jgi:hypothetical protein
MSDSGNQTPTGDNESVTEGSPPKKKFLNGWTSELEDLMADWADRAACYRWMHEQTSRIYGGRDRMITIPVIILSTITGSASLALDSFFPNSDPNTNLEIKKFVQSGIGGVSILAGIITTVGNFLRYAQGCEAHHLAAVSWGKFNRLICIEMRLHPNERMDNYNFLKMFRVELDRLIEQSPPIPDIVIQEFKKVFQSTEDVRKPEIVGILEHTKVYKDSGARLKRIAAEAAITLHHKKNVLKNMIIEDLDRKFRNAAIEEARKVAKDIIQDQMAKQRKSAKADASSTQDLVARQKKERAEEINKFSNTGLVSELKNRFRKVESDNKIYPETPGVMNPTVRFEETSEIPAIDTDNVQIQVQEKSKTDYTYTENTVTTMSDFPSIPVTPYQESDDEYMANAVSGSATDNEEDRDKK